MTDGRRRRAPVRRAPVRWALAIGLLLALPAPAALGGGAAGVAEPDGIWTGPMRGEVPATLAGAAVLDADGVAALVAAGDAVLVDVGPPPRRPEGLAADAKWLPPPHRSIPGAVWLPGVGAGELDPAVEAWYRDRLAALAGGDMDRPLVVFCHPQCWGSWNAAKRAVLYGHRAVHWFPGGIEGWQDAGHPTRTVEPETPGG